MLKIQGAGGKGWPCQSKIGDDRERDFSLQDIIDDDSVLLAHEQH